MLLTGESGRGKTTLCVRVVESLKARGVDVAGVLTLPRLMNGEKIGMDVEDISTGERCTLAERALIGQGTANLAWKFHADGLARGAQILRGATPCDVLVIDELGPLELIHNDGWIIALDVLQTGNYRDALVVIRPRLLENFQMRLNSNVQVLTMVQAHREELLGQIVHHLDLRIHKNLHE
jgi:nucleoside-triphosphatase